MYQFIHIESYARTASKIKRKSKFPKKEKVWTVKDVFDEALRRNPDACKHVENPQKPNFLYGTEDDINKIESRIDAACMSFKNPDGRKLRADAHVLLAGVVSFPRRLSDISPSSYEHWKDKNLDFLKKKYGSNLVGVIEHLDEAQPHLHFYVINEPNPNVKPLHDGFRNAASEKTLTPEYDEKYKEGMKRLQDDYYREVAINLGMLRSGPRRKRLTRDEYISLKQEAEQLATLRQSSESYAEMLMQKKLELDAKVIELTPLITKLKKNVEEYERRLKEMDHIEATIYDMSIKTPPHQIDFTSSNIDDLNII